MFWLHSMDGHQNYRALFILNSSLAALITVAISWFGKPQRNPSPSHWKVDLN
jgi:hypothetical protein